MVAVISVREVNQPSAFVPPNPLKQKITKPAINTIDVQIILRPVEWMVSTTVTLASDPFADCCLKFTKKRMVISMAIPSATLKIKTVDGFSGIPTHPITPAVITSGIKFGNKEHNKIFHDLNRYNIHNAIRRNAHKILSFKPLMI